MLRRLAQLMTRKQTKVIFGDLSRMTPVSAVFGLDRGTPIDRYYIENFLAANNHLIGGEVLEVGGSAYSRRFGGPEVQGIRVLHTTGKGGGATIVGDLTREETLPEKAVDCFICTQTFNFIYDLEKAVQGAHYLLRPGGTLLATVAGISQISRYDMQRWGDYWRFTSESLRRLLEPVFTGGVEILSFGNVLAACAFLQGIAVEELPNQALLDTIDPDYQMILAAVARRAP